MARLTISEQDSIIRRRERIEAHLARGLESSYQIAAALAAEGIEVNPRTVQRDVKAVDAELRERYLDDRQARKLRKVREAEQRNADLRSRIAALDAEWERSKADKTRKRKKTVAGGATGRTETQAEVEGRLGDVAYLGEIRQILAEIRKNDELIARLLGLEAPRQVAPTTPDGAALPMIAVMEVVRPDAPHLATADGDHA